MWPFTDKYKYLTKQEFINIISSIREPEGYFSGRSDGHTEYFYLTNLYVSVGCGSFRGSFRFSSVKLSLQKGSDSVKLTFVLPRESYLDIRATPKNIKFSGSDVVLTDGHTTMEIRLH